MKTGCLICCDELNPNLITPERLPDYDVPIFRLLDPSSQLVVNNPVPNESMSNTLKIINPIRYCLAMTFNLLKLKVQKNIMYLISSWS